MSDLDCLWSEFLILSLNSARRNESSTGGKGRNGEEEGQERRKETRAHREIEIRSREEEPHEEIHDEGPNVEEGRKIRTVRRAVVENAFAGMTRSNRGGAAWGAVSLAILAALSLSREAAATTVLAKSFESICHESDMVFVGSVTGVESRWAAPEQGTIETLVTFSDLIPLFGVDSQKVVLRFAGGAVDGIREEIAGMPHFEVGDRVVVFAREGRFVSPIVGFHQGLFEVVERDGAPVVLNERGVPVTAVDGKSLRLGSTAGGASSAMALDVFLDRVRDTLATRR